MTQEMPVPRYAIGAKVWHAYTSRETKKYPCPDCRGTSLWRATTATGEQFDISCVRCMGGHPDIPGLTRVAEMGLVRQLTIGSVRIDTAERDGRFVSYMCVETGVGSGSIYWEALLHETEAEARLAAAALQSAEQAALDTQPWAMRGADYAGRTFSSALAHHWREEVYHAADVARHYRQAIENVAGEEGYDFLDTPDAIRRHLKDALDVGPRTYLRQHPFDALLAAAVAVVDDTSPSNIATLKEAIAPCEYKPAPLVSSNDEVE